MIEIRRTWELRLVIFCPILIKNNLNCEDGRKLKKLILSLFESLCVYLFMLMYKMSLSYPSAFSDPFVFFRFIFPIRGNQAKVRIFHVNAARCVVIKWILTSCRLFPPAFSLNMTSTPKWWYFSERGREKPAMVWTSVFTSWAEPETDRVDWDLLLTSSIWTEAVLLLISARKRIFDQFDYQLIIVIVMLYCVKSDMLMF